MSAKASKINANEKDLLARLVNLHKNVVECKITNKYKTVDKTNEWRKIEAEWLTHVTPRTNGKPKPDEDIRPRKWEQIKKSWENLKSRAKKDYAEDRRETFQTGGGKKNFQVDETSVKIRDMCTSQFDCLENPYDDDHIAPPPKTFSDQLDEIVVNLDEPLPSTSSALPSTIFTSAPPPAILTTGNSLTVSSSLNSHSTAAKSSLNSATGVTATIVQNKKAATEKYLKSIENPPPPPGSNIEISKGSKRKAENFIMGSAEEEHKLRVSVLENENALFIKKQKIADLKLKYWQAKYSNLYNMDA